MKKVIRESHICAWIGDGEGCRNPVLYGKSYCEKHQERVYLKLLPEMANFITDKEVDSEFKRE